MVSSSTEKAREAAGKHADATRESYRIVVSRAFAARESNSRLARDFFERTTVEIQEQARMNRCATDQFAAHTGGRDEALSPDGPDGMYSFLGPPPDGMRN